MSLTTKRRSWLAIPVALSLAVGGVALTSVPAIAAPGPFVTATPNPITPEEFAATGVHIQGQSLNSGGFIQRQDIEITYPDGETRLTTYFNPANPDDGTFDTFVKSAVTPVELGTYTVVTHGFAGEASLATATTTFTVAAPPADPPATISVNPAAITPDAFIANGVQVSGRTFDTGSAVGIERSNIVLTSPSGATAKYFDLTADGTFNVNVKPKDAVLTDPLEQGTYTLTATSLLRPEFTATTTFVVAGTQTPPPATVSVTPTKITPADFVATGVQASGRTFDTGSTVGIERSNLVLTSPSGKTADYFDLTADGTFNVNIKPKGDISANPVEEGTYTLTATSLLQPEYTATTTFVVASPPAPPVVMDPFVKADVTKISVSDFGNGGVRLSGFTEDTPGPLTRQDIFVTSPSGVEVHCTDFTGDGTFDVQVYAKNAPEQGPAGQRTCAFTADTVEVGTYQVLSYGFIRENARATTSFEVVADAVVPTPGGGTDVPGTGGNTPKGTLPVVSG